MSIYRFPCTPAPPYDIYFLQALGSYRFRGGGQLLKIILFPDVVVYCININAEHRKEKCLHMLLKISLLWIRSHFCRIRNEYHDNIWVYLQTKDPDPYLGCFRIGIWIQVTQKTGSDRIRIRNTEKY